MAGTYTLRLALSALAFALGLGLALAIRYEPPPDLAAPTCPDCRSPTGVPVTYTRDPTTGNLQASTPYGVLGPYEPYPATGPKWYCPKCQGAWGPPDFRRPGRRG